MNTKNTKIFKEDLTEAADILKNGGLVAVPTETVYGLAGNGLNEKAVSEIYEVKGRPAVKPLSLMVPDESAMEKYCLDVPPQAKTLAAKFWPGPLTIVLRARDFIPSIVLAGGTTVGLRCPDHPMTLELLRLSGVPFAAPSANPSGEESPKNAQRVRDYFDGKIDGIVDGGQCGIGTESTLISLASAPYKIFRRGALSEEEIADCLVSGMRIIGLTGNSGCGKTTALRVLGDMGALTIDCDELYHELLESDTDMIAELSKAFPEAAENGGIDRKRLGALVFSDSEKLKTLNNITHKCVKAEVIRRLRTHAMNGGTLAAIDAVELISGGLSELCSTVVGVVSHREHRMERIMNRDGIEKEAASMRISAQYGDEYLHEKCSIILENNSTKAAFITKCKNIFKELINNG